MSSKTSKPTVLALGAALAGGLVLGGSAFAMTPLASGYMVSASAVAEGSCGADHKAAEGAADKKVAGDKTAAEGKCGMDKMDANKDGQISREEYAAAHKDGGGNFDSHDTDKNGFISAKEMEAHMGGAGGEGKAGMEGKCGEGKCGAG